MKHRQLNESGSLLVPFILVLVLLLGSLGFGAWAFMSRQDYKNNSDAKAAVAAKKAVDAEDIKKDAEFAEAEKSPTKSYLGSATYGSLAFQYPKTWSAYISESGRGAAPIDGYFSPGVVPDFQSGVLWALRFNVINSPYATVLKTYDANAKTGKVTVAAYRAPKVSSALGSIITGEIRPKVEGQIVLLPLRDKTIMIWTEGKDYRNDFNGTVLASLTFSP
ncbi:hypothetical protein BH10PAT3_BH10PAT3_5120 [soil metagenome]